MSTPMTQERLKEIGELPEKLGKLHPVYHGGLAFVDREGVLSISYRLHELLPPLLAEVKRLQETEVLLKDTISLCKHISDEVDRLRKVEEDWVTLWLMTDEEVNQRELENGRLISELEVLRAGNEVLKQAVERLAEEVS